jgi:hypothetical protein
MLECLDDEWFLLGAAASSSTDSISAGALAEAHHRSLNFASDNCFTYVDMSLPRAPAVKQSSSQRN